MHRSVPLCAGQSGQKVPNGCQIKFEGILAALAAVYQPGLEHRLMQMLSEFSNPLSQPSKSKVVRRRWIVADDLRDNLELLESLKGKTCCRQVKFYSGVYALASRWFCLSRILQAGPEPIRF